GTPILLNLGVDTQTATMHGTCLERITQISANDHEDVNRMLRDSGEGNARSVTVKLKPGVKAGPLLSVKMNVTTFEQPVSADDVFEVAGPKPAISAVRESVQGGPAVATRSDEI